jgi:large subunit ribosomal protein L21
MKYAIIKFAGKQIKVSEGDVLSVEKQEDPLNISVLLFKDDKEVRIGTPEIDDIEVRATIVKEYKGDKIRVSRFRSKSRYRRERSHRQPMTDIKIEKIGPAGKRSAKKNKDSEIEEKAKVLKKSEKVKESSEKKQVKEKKTVKKKTATKTEETKKKSTKKAENTVEKKGKKVTKK